MPRATFVIGIAGVGKSTVAETIGRTLAASGSTTAVVDTGMLAQFGPLPNRTELRGSAFYNRLKYVNLAMLGAARIEDFTVVNERPAAMVAKEIVTRADWIGPGG